MKKTIVTITLLIISLSVFSEERVHFQYIYTPDTLDSISINIELNKNGSGILEIINLAYNNRKTDEYNMPDENLRGSFKKPFEIYKLQIDENSGLLESLSDIQKGPADSRYDDYVTRHVTSEGKVTSKIIPVENFFYHKLIVNASDNNEGSFYGFFTAGDDAEGGKKTTSFSNVLKRLQEIVAGKIKTDYPTINNWLDVKY